MNVHFFRGIQKSFPRTIRTTTANKPFLRPRHVTFTLSKRNLVRGKEILELLGSARFIQGFEIPALFPFEIRGRK